LYHHSSIEAYKLKEIKLNLEREKHVKKGPKRHQQQKVRKSQEFSGMGCLQIF